MQGYMNEEVLQKIFDMKQVIFFSCSKNCLWIKGEIFGNFLVLVDIKVDCDQDFLLVYVYLVGLVCYKGIDICWVEDNYLVGFFGYLELVI